jgi:hypothetical protein
MTTISHCLHNAGMAVTTLTKSERLASEDLASRGTKPAITQSLQECYVHSDLHFAVDML